MKAKHSDSMVATRIARGAVPVSALMYVPVAVIRPAVIAVTVVV